MAVGIGSFCLVIGWSFGGLNVNGNEVDRPNKSPSTPATCTASIRQWVLSKNRQQSVPKLQHNHSFPPVVHSLSRHCCYHFPKHSIHQTKHNSTSTTTTTKEWREEKTGEREQQQQHNPCPHPIVLAAARQKKQEGKALGEALVVSLTTIEGKRLCFFCKVVVENGCS